MKRPLRIVLCEENPYEQINVLGSFSVILQPCNFYKVEVTYTSSAGKTVTNITLLLRSFSFELEFESFKSMKYSWCYEFSKVGLFFIHPG